MSTITLPTLVEGATLKLTDPRGNNDADFVTKKGRPVDAVCVDHAIIVLGKGTAAVRLLFVVVEGQSDNDQDVKGRNIVTDKYISANAAPYTFADMRLMGWNVKDGAEIEALEAVANGDMSKSGLGNKVVRIDIKSDSFNGQPVNRVAGVSQPPQKLSGGDVKSKFAGLADAVKKSKDGRPSASPNAGAAGAPGNRNPTSPPPARTDGTGTAADTDEIPF